MRRLPDRIITLGRAAIDPDRPDPMHLKTGGIPMANEPQKANKTGVYVTNGVPQRFKEGDVLPDGAELRKEQPEGDTLIVSPRMEEKAAIAAEDEKRARGKAPENRAK